MPRLLAALEKAAGFTPDAAARGALLVSGRDYGQKGLFVSSQVAETMCHPQSLQSGSMQTLSRLRGNVNAMISWPWFPHTTSGFADNALGAAQTALHHAYLAGFKDGLLISVAIFSILLVLFRRD